jgi:hypothetical protein
VIGFTLPTLAPGETIDAATFSITISSSNNGGGTNNVSLFGLTTTNPDGTGTSLYSTSAAGAISSTFTNTNATAGDTPTADVLTFVNSFYTGGGVPSQTEIFFRLNVNTATFATVNRASFATDTAELSLNVVPEPSAAMLGALGGLALLRRRR